MVAEVSSMVDGGNSEILITRDLLGGFSKASQKHIIDEDSQLSNGLEITKPLSGPSVSSFSSRGLKFLQEESCLGLKLLPSNSSHYCQSVCTLDKVKSALQRAENVTIKKRSSSQSLDGTKQVEDEDERKSSSSTSGMFAAGCPGCLLYVITLATDPKCPRCNTIVPLPRSSPAKKKPRIDLNSLEY